MRQDRGRQQPSLYGSTKRSRNKDTCFRFSKQAPVDVFYYIDGQFGNAVSSTIDKATLADVAAMRVRWADSGD